MEAEIGRRSGRQHRLITVEQLARLGLTPSGTRSRLARGRLFRIRHGVYATHPPPYTREQQWMAAVLACGMESVLSDWPGAIHLGIAPEDWSELPPHVTVPNGRGRTREGIVVHQREVGPRDRRIKDGIPVASAELVLVHLSPALEAPELARAMVAAESLGILNRRRLRELVDERAGRPGVGKLLPLLARAPARARSDLELLMVPVLHEAGVPWPRFNHPVRVPERERPLIVDLYWPDLRLVVELDSQRWHGDWERAEEDRERDQLLWLAGESPHRFVRRQLKREPLIVADRLRRLVELRARQLASSALTAPFQARPGVKGHPQLSI